MSLKKAGQEFDDAFLRDMSAGLLRKECIQERLKAVMLAWPEKKATGEAIRLLMENDIDESERLLVMLERVLEIRAIAVKPPHPNTVAFVNEMARRFNVNLPGPW